ncbi:Hsp20 family protein [Ancylomarina sp. 16SWW S1-10-2]|uniref:Hsp20 family protein n=1 Tax=Ancylomarina sp. 16SWW S1-10-2 TaxID=2499681 RepID=UPI001D71E28D|nr:Hsp20 family protein [Ancylomarina sp. 16SWW S1-10-2]
MSIVNRFFRLPVNLIDGDKILAKYKEGIMSIHLPKKGETKPKPSRIISIK